SAQFDIDASDRERLVAEAESRALLGGDGWGTPAARAHQRVSIYGLGRTGAGLALQLAAAGIGTLQLSDTSPVRPRDLGPVFIPALLGMPRDEALSRIINAHGYGCQVRTRGRWTQPDLAVMVDYEVANPTQASFLATHGVDHLSVVVGEVGISCGPWVRAGEGPCLRCVSLARRDEDPCWPGIAAQQHARSVVARRGEDSTLAALTATYATTQVLAALAGRAVAVAGRVLTYSLPDYALNWRDVAIHPACTEHNRRDLSGGPARRGGKGRQSPPPDQPDSEPEYTRQAA
ncbi:MAG: hypothetical protein LBR19_07780, partial [Bifidobacteriaceae bacterium]|nr:hypothetical protein [Bifidobacteriaceae bacterium]